MTRRSPWRAPVMPDLATTFPESIKMAKASDNMTAIAEFLTWWVGQNVTPADIKGKPEAVERLLCEYFKIDYDKLNAERKELTKLRHAAQGLT
jgi:hypothetical protein